jgi:hypothetical protein
MMSMTTSLLLVVALLASEWIYLRAFFRSVEPALIERVEAALDVKIGFGLLHHWQVREWAGEEADRSRLGVSTLVSAIHLLVMLGFAIGLLAVAAVVVSPIVWWHHRS